MYVVINKDITIHIENKQYIDPNFENNPPEDTKFGIIPSIPKNSTVVGKKTSKAVEKRYNMSTILNTEAELLEIGWTKEEIDNGKEVVNKYVNKWHNKATSEMYKYGIPASIKLAQALIESDAGESRLCSTSSNHFGIKCGCTWNKKCSTGKCVNYHDDHARDRFRVYGSDDDSYRDHSLFLTDPKKSYRYGFLFKIPVSDYKSWARGLRTSGYATGKYYDAKIIKTIKILNLTKYDKTK